MSEVVGLLYVYVNVNYEPELFVQKHLKEEKKTRYNFSFDSGT